MPWAVGRAQLGELGRPGGVEADVLKFFDYMACGEEWETVRNQRQDGGSQGNVLNFI